jgi:hypothetical protein
MTMTEDCGTQRIFTSDEIDRLLTMLNPKAIELIKHKDGLCGSRVFYFKISFEMERDLLLTQIGGRHKPAA